MVKRRVYSREFKLSILQQLETKSVAQVAKESTIHPMQIYTWKRELAARPAKAFAGHGNICKLEAEVAHYQKLVGKLYAEVEFLKKASEDMKERLAEERAKRS